MGVSNFINSWLRDIVVLFIFISIVDLIMAKGTMKKYIDFVIGLLVIFTVINPFLKLAKVNFNLDGAVTKYIDSSMETSADVLDTKADTDIETIYVAKVSNEITRIIEDSTPYGVNKVNIDIERGENFGEIKFVDLILTESKKENKKEENKSNINIKKVETISVGNGFKNKIDEKSDDNNQDIKQLLSENLNIDSHLITISFRNEGD